MITYVQPNRNTPSVIVKLDGKIVGRILEIFEGGTYGFAYYPNGSKTRGEVLPTVLAVKRTLDKA